MRSETPWLLYQQRFGENHFRSVSKIHFVGSVVDRCLLDNLFVYGLNCYTLYTLTPLAQCNAADMSNSVKDVSLTSTKAESFQSFRQVLFWSAAASTVFSCSGGDAQTRSPLFKISPLCKMFAVVQNVHCCGKCSPPCKIFAAVQNFTAIQNVVQEKDVRPATAQMGRLTDIGARSIFTTEQVGIDRFDCFTYKC